MVRSIIQTTQEGVGQGADLQYRRKGLQRPKRFFGAARNMRKMVSDGRWFADSDGVPHDQAALEHRIKDLDRHFADTNPALRRCARRDILPCYSPVTGAEQM